MSNSDIEGYKQYLISQGHDPNEVEQYGQYLQSQQQPSSDQSGMWDSIKHGAAQVGLGALKALDYAGGLARTGVYGAIDDVRRLPDVASYVAQNGKLPSDDFDNAVVTSQDKLNALKGSAPSSNEYFEKAGIPKGPNVELNLPVVGKINPSVRGAVGMVADGALDPAMYLTGGAAALDRAALEAGGKDLLLNAASKGAKVADSVVNAPSHLVGKLGNKVYKSGLKRIDQEVAEYGKEPVSDVLMQHNIAGTANSINDQMQGLSDKLLFERNKILQEATNNGATTSMDKAMVPVDQKIALIRASRDPKLQPLADALESEAKKYRALDYQAAYTPVEFQPAKKMDIELPQQGKYTGDYQEIEGFRKPQLVQGSLPVQGQYTGEYTKIGGWKKPEYQHVDLPTGSKQSLDFEGAQSFNQSVPNIGIDKLPSKAIPGERVPEQLTQLPEVPFMYVDKGGAIPGKRVSGEFVPQAPVPGTFIEEAKTIAGKTVPEVRAVTPVESSGFKTTVGATIPDTAWRDPAISSAYKNANKTFYSGLQNETENAVGKTLGSEKQALLHDYNDQLGRVLTAQDRAQMEAQKEARKHALTQVDALAAAADPSGTMLLLKKAAGIAQMTGPRTYTGRFMRNNQNVLGQILKHGAINQTKDQSQMSPWMTMGNQ